MACGVVGGDRSRWAGRALAVAVACTKCARFGLGSHVRRTTPSRPCVCPACGSLVVRVAGDRVSGQTVAAHRRRPALGGLCASRRAVGVGCRAAGLLSCRAARLVLRWRGRIERNRRPPRCWLAISSTWHIDRWCAHGRLASGGTTSRVGRLDTRLGPGYMPPQWHEERKDEEEEIRDLSPERPDAGDVRHFAGRRARGRRLHRRPFRQALRCGRGEVWWAPEVILNILGQRAGVGGAAQKDS